MERRSLNYSPEIETHLAGLPRKELPLHSIRRTLSRQDTLEFLEALKASAGPGRTLHLPPGRPRVESEGRLAEIVGTGSPAFSELVSLTLTSKMGLVLFWGPGRQCVIVPPFPVSPLLSDGYRTDALRGLLQRDLIIAMILVRLGSYAIGLCRGETLLTSKVGTGLIHGRHRQGGSSAARFRRHREKQIESFLTRVCSHVCEHLEPALKTIDYVVYGGARTTVLLLQKECRFLEQFNDRALPPLLTIGEPRQAVLEEAIRLVWSSTITEWDDRVSPSR